jgi:hypothetical protein
MYGASRTNQITYNYFRQLGGLACPVVQKVQRRNGSYIYYTYHLMNAL